MVDFWNHINWKLFMHNISNVWPKLISCYPTSSELNRESDIVDALVGQQLIQVKSKDEMLTLMESYHATDRFVYGIVDGVIFTSQMKMVLNVNFETESKPFKRI